MWCMSRYYGGEDISPDDNTNDTENALVGEEESPH